MEAGLTLLNASVELCFWFGEANWTENSTQQLSRQIFSSRTGLNAVQLAIGVTIFLTNCLFLSLLGYRRKRLQWKRYALIANMAVADACAGCALITVGVFALVKRGYTKWLLLALSASLSTSTSLTAVSYNFLIVIQYLAIKRPLWYKTLVTRKKLVAAITLAWITNPGYAVLKTYLLISDNPDHYRNLMFYELTFLLGTCTFNTGAYFYVLYVAVVKKNCRTATLRNVGCNGVACNVSTSVENSVWTVHGSRLRLELQPQPPCSRSQRIFKQYRFLVTAGLNLIAFWVSVLPPIIIYAVVIAKGEQLFFTQSFSKHVVMLLWFVRSFCDPIIYTLREKKLLHRPRTDKNRWSHGSKWTSAALTGSQSQHASVVAVMPRKATPE